MTLPHRPIPYSFSQKNEVLVLSAQQETLCLLIGNNATTEILTELHRYLQRPTSIKRCNSAEFQEELSRFYSQNQNSAADIVTEAEKEMNLSDLLEDIPVSEDLLLDGKNSAPIIKTINSLITQAIRDGSSDIHLEPFENKTSIRLRIDGVLQEIATSHPAMHNALASRIKVMAKLNIAEKRLPQDGRISLRLGTRLLDIRVSIVPTLYAERVVLRVLDKSTQHLSLSDLGMPTNIKKRMHELLNIPNGIILVTGPTGSGKTTTLYACLESLDHSSINIMTVEDPVEYDLPGIAQVPIHHRIDMNFSKALKSILRQDPDVIMIGEIRDRETAKIAIEASLTGHLVIATLHTNDCPSSITRLIDMGIEPFLLAPAIRGVLSQRLVRRLCPHCRILYPLQEKEKTLLQLSNNQTHSWKPQGCTECYHRGYKGRVGVFSLLTINKELEEIIHNNQPEHQLRSVSKSINQYIELLDTGKSLVEEGLTSTEELIRILKGYE